MRFLTVVVGGVGVVAAAAAAVAMEDRAAVDEEVHRVGQATGAAWWLGGCMGRSVEVS